MKICFVVPGDGLAGGLRVIAQNARYLHDSGHEVTVVGPPLSAPGIREVVRRMLGRARRAERRGPSQTGGHLSDAGVNFRLLDRHRPVEAGDVPDGDLVVATWWETAEWVSTFPDTKGRKIYLCQGYEAFQPCWKERVDATYRAEMWHIYVSEWVKEQIRAVAPESRGEVVHPGVDLSRFHFVERTRNQSPVAGFMGSQSSLKGPDIAFQALTRLKSIWSDLRVVSFRADPSPAGLPDWFDVETRPSQSRISEIYRSCDVWLFSSRAEGFGLPILEAMASGTPVAATSAGAAPDLVTRDVGRRADSIDAAALAEAAEEILRLDAEEWRALSLGARRRAEENSVERSAARFLAATEAALGGSQAPS